MARMVPIGASDVIKPAAVSNSLICIVLMLLPQEVTSVLLAYTMQMTCSWRWQEVRPAFKMQVSLNSVPSTCSCQHALLRAHRLALTQYCMGTCLQHVTAAAGGTPPAA